MDWYLPRPRAAVCPSSSGRVCQQACNVLLRFPIIGLDNGSRLVGEPVDGRRLDHPAGPGQFADPLFVSVPVAVQRHCSETPASFGDGGIEHGRGGEVGDAAVRVGGAFRDRGPFAGLGLDTSGGVADSALSVLDLACESFLA